MKLGEALQEKLLDVRLRDKLLAEGKVTPKQIEEFLKTIPDDANNAAFTGGEKTSGSSDQ
ncbi:MAG: hypothetical protein HN509_17395 [Halobacteriovoraceae bacterium]|nr:hypothetical protein [Halobacteriovoraceae bacterium]MBT5095884.1 hypothetical protein [Halobacteriovoraceae bacterium]